MADRHVPVLVVGAAFVKRGGQLLHVDLPEVVHKAEAAAGRVLGRSRA